MIMMYSEIKTACMKNFCESLREQAMEKTNLKRKKDEVIDKRAAEII